MTEPIGRDGMPSVSSGHEHTGSALPFASWPALAGHLLALLAAVIGAAPLHTLLVAAVACSIIAIAASSTFRPLDVPARRAIVALISGHGAVAAMLLAGIAPSVPRAIPLAGLAAAVALGLAGLVLVRSPSTVHRPPRPLTLAPRVAAIALVVQALAQRWAASASGLSMPLRAAILLAIAALGLPLLASLSILCLRLRARWAIAGLLAWTVGWVALTADLSALALLSLGHPLPPGSHPVDAELVQVIATVGGLGIGAALVTSIRDLRFRHSTVVLLVGYAVFGVLAAIAQHRIELATDFPRVTALRNDRDMAHAIMAFALAGVLWLYWRRVSRDAGPP